MPLRDYYVILLHSHFVPDYLRMGWMFADHAQTQREEFSTVIMMWPCQCKPVYRDKHARRPA